MRARWLLLCGGLILAAALLTEETIALGNLPLLADITTLGNLLQQLGVQVHLNGGSELDGSKGRTMKLTAAEIASRVAVVLASTSTVGAVTDVVPKSVGCAVYWPIQARVVSSIRLMPTAAPIEALAFLPAAIAMPPPIERISGVDSAWTFTALVATTVARSSM